jgi:hypothetical protein
MSSPQHDHTFYRSMAVAIAVVVFGGFSRTYLSALANGTSTVPAIIHVHAVVFTSWLLVFVLQTTLIGRDRVALHKTVGTGAMFLAGLMVIVGVATAITMARLDHRGIPGVEFPDAGGFLLLNLVAIVLFAVLTGAAWVYRKTPQIHKRLMLMGTASTLVGPGVSRLPFVAGHTPAIAILALAFLFAGPIYDLVSRRRLHPAYIVGAVLGFLSGPPVIAAVSATSAWHGIAAWLMR